MKHAPGTVLVRKFGVGGSTKEICLVLPWWAGGVLWISSPFFSPGEINRKLILAQFQPLEPMMHVLYVPPGVCEKFADLRAYFVKDLSFFRVGIFQTILLNLGIVRACVINDTAPVAFTTLFNWIVAVQNGLLNVRIINSLVSNGKTPLWFKLLFVKGAPLILKTTYSKDWGDWHGWLVISYWARDLSFLA